jgi:hypothetical protein
MRFEAEKTIGKAWLVWDYLVKDVAVIDGMPASGLSQEAATRSAEKLNKLDRELGIFRSRPWSRVVKEPPPPRTTRQGR